MRRLLERLRLQRVVYMLVITAVVLSLGGANFARAGGFGDSPANVVFYGDRLASAFQPVLFQNRAYIPAEALGVLDMQVEWDAISCTLLINSSPGSVPVKPGTLYQGYLAVNTVINDRLVSPDYPALLHDGTVWVPLRMLSELGLRIGWDKRTATAFVGTLSPDVLPSVGSLESLQKLVQGRTLRYMYKALEGAIDDSVTAAPEAGNDSQSAQPSHSETNVQVAGVDESDIVKTDGNFIYQVSGQIVNIIKAWPVEEAERLAAIGFGDQSFTPQELYIHGDQLVVIGQTSGGPMLEKLMITSSGVAASPAMSRPAPWYDGWYPLTKAIIYDTSNKVQPRLVREVVLEGGYLSSRKIDGYVHLLASKHLYHSEIMQPFYRDSAAGDGFYGVPYADIKYFPGHREPSYLMVASFDLGKPDQAATVDAYLGAGNNVYMSRGSLYVTLSRWHDANTAVYRFAVNPSGLTYAAKGEVPGHILNQFSMDEYEQHLRIATTAQDEHGRTTNNVYILDNQLIISGQLEGIAPGERIYSARFMGAKGYLVTFEQVDPLFVLDLADHKQPHILGALKIPGFSTYLHPLDATHLLGLGRDTQVIERKDPKGNALDSPIVLQQGLKLAIFDVTDVANPIELDAVTIGGRGSHAEALYNHKALLFEQESGMLAFAAGLTAGSTDPWEYGAFEFQGALFFEVDTDKGITQLGAVTHLTEEEYQKLGYYWGGSQDEVRRVLRIANNLYIISNGKITIHDRALKIEKTIDLR